MLMRHVLPFDSGHHRCTGAMVGGLMAVERVSNWVNQFDLELIPTRHNIRVVVRPFTQPVALHVEVLDRRYGNGS